MGMARHADRLCTQQFLAQKKHKKKTTNGQNQIKSKMRQAGRMNNDSKIVDMEQLV
jgi:hypothetical protein